MNHMNMALNLFKSGMFRVVNQLQGRQFVHLLHIGKTGGTAVKHALRPHVVTDRIALRLHPHRVKLWHIPHGEKIFFFVRDPIARYISGFYSRQRQCLPRYLAPWTPGEKEAFTHFSTANQLAEALTSFDPVERQHAETAMKNIRHVMDSYWDWFGDEQQFLPRREDFLLVGHQETLPADFARLCEMLALPEGIALPQDDTQSHKNPEHVDKSLTDLAIGNLRDWYRRDYEFLDLCAQHIEGADAAVPAVCHR